MSTVSVGLDISLDPESIYIYLVRHSITEWNLQRRFQGVSDIPLHQTGIEQAEEASRTTFAGLGPKLDGVYSSVLKRAVQTAEIISGWPSGKIITYQELAECNFGTTEGMLLSEYNEVYKDQLDRYFEVLSPLECLHFKRAENAESLAEVHERASKCVLEILKKHKPGQRILITTHAGVINTFAAFHIKNADIRGIRTENLGYMLIEAKNSEFKVIKTHGIKIGEPIRK